MNNIITQALAVVLGLQIDPEIIILRKKISDLETKLKNNCSHKDGRDYSDCCSTCGIDLYDDIKFCNHCGNGLLNNEKLIECADCCYFICANCTVNCICGRIDPSKFHRWIATNTCIRCEKQCTRCNEFRCARCIKQCDYCKTDICNDCMWCHQSTHEI